MRGVDRTAVTGKVSECVCVCTLVCLCTRVCVSLSLS